MDIYVIVKSNSLYDLDFIQYKQLNRLDDLELLTYDGIDSVYSILDKYGCISLNTNTTYLGSTEFILIDLNNDNLIIGENIYQKYRYVIMDIYNLLKQARRDLNLKDLLDTI